MAPGSSGTWKKTLSLPVTAGSSTFQVTVPSVLFRRKMLLRKLSCTPPGCLAFSVISRWFGWFSGT